MVYDCMMRKIIVLVYMKGTEICLQNTRSQFFKLCIKIPYAVNSAMNAAVRVARPVVNAVGRCEINVHYMISKPIIDPPTPFFLTMLTTSLSLLGKSKFVTSTSSCSWMHDDRHDAWSSWLNRFITWHQVQPAALASSPCINLSANRI